MNFKLVLAALCVASASALEVSLIENFSVETNPTHYGNPSGGCMSDEKSVQVTGVSGDFCSPECSSSGTCPTDIPSKVTAQPMCALQTTTGDKYCALICSPSTDFKSLRAGDSQCGEGSCQAISGVGICTYSDKEQVVVASKSAQSVNDGFCGVISADLPSFCVCAEEQGGFSVDCEVNFLDIDTIGVKGTVLPCASPASMSLEILEADMGIDDPIAGISAGYSGDIPIPGLDVSIPLIGDAGVQAAVSISGNADSFTYSIGLDACVDIPIIGSECGADLDPGQLPIPVLSGTYSFGNLC